MDDRKKCPFCGKLNERDHIFCVYCGRKFEFQISSDAYCLNCGRPVQEGHDRCRCGYEFADVKCPDCGSLNSYTNNRCISCGVKLWSGDGIFPKNPPKGCMSSQKMLLDLDFLEREFIKDPHNVDGMMYKSVLRREYSRNNQMTDEVVARWPIVAGDTCKSCRAKISPSDEACPKCGIVHHDVSVKSKGFNTYAPSRKSVFELSSLKWSYKLSDEDFEDYLRSLSPMIGESRADYAKRLFREWAEISAISYLIISEWYRYFAKTCMQCDAQYERYKVACPTCAAKKRVTALGALHYDVDTHSDAFPRQHEAFTDDVKQICRDNGGDTGFARRGIVGCPKCSNYFHYLTTNFIDTHKCPHCGLRFRIDAEIYDDEYHLSGLSYEEYMEEFYDEDF